MFSMFPFMFKNTDIIGELFNDVIFNNVMNQIPNNLVNENVDENTYDIDFKDQGDYYLVKGYLPGLTPRDVRIDFEKNKAILSIKKKQIYSNGTNIMMTVIQTGGYIVKTFDVEEIDKSKISASFDNSVLLLTLPKKKKSEIYNKEEVPTIIDVENYEME
ncbi:Hsp20/alpha crystallin family protein [Clostridium sp. YIM B02551]|uniref:Hsp20/alpha crystallin family protein n=1 Tax=Clostridium sp. YIM B02551 TaxID=2910679 RepID=UPI001EEAEC89|nr:Hsp20 family protein [Clostridium sp. YIM B02551]